MKTKYAVLILLFPLLCFSQKQGNTWYFGSGAGLDFNSGSPVAISGGQTYSPDATPVEGTSVISDSSGSLLFYSNGQKIWNRNHQIMPNGDSLLGHWSSTQAALIVPLPGSSRYFYVFTTDAYYQDNLQYGFRYNVVDICLDNGLGDVIPGQKNILLLNTVTEKLTAVKHFNGIDYWIITHKLYSNAFYAYRLSSTGITDTVISYVGSSHIGTPAAAIGQLKASPDGNKLAIVNGNAGIYSIAEYFEFNKTTGRVSNCVNLQPTFGFQPQFYGVSFSPDNSKLYIACWLNCNGVYQFDLNAGGGNADSVRDSKTLIHGVSNFYGMQLGPDGKIYLVTGGWGYLSVINNPNLSGSNCNFVASAIAITGSSGMEPPNLIDSYDYSNTTNACGQPSGLENDFTSGGISVFPNPFSESAVIKFENEIQDATIFICNSFGQKILLAENFSGTEFKVRRKNLSGGAYFVEVISKGKRVYNSTLIVSPSE